MLAATAALQSKLDKSRVGQETKISVGELTRLMSLVSRTAERTGVSLDQTIGRIERVLDEEAVPDFRRERMAIGEFVGNLRRMRVRRNDIIGADLFRDPAWDMLLELYAAHQRGETVPVNSLCYASGTPPTTALRHIKRMREHGLVERVGDSDDERRVRLRPTAKAVAGVEASAARLLQLAQFFGSNSEADGDS